MRYGEISTRGSFGDFLKPYEEAAAGAKNKCTESEDNMDLAYATYKSDFNIFNNSKWEQYSLNKILKELEEDKRIAKNQAREKALNEGKTEAEITQILEGIDSQYADKISLAFYNSTQSTGKMKLNKGIFDSSLSAYRNSRYENIFATNNYLSALGSLRNANYELGRLTQRSIVESYTNGNHLNLPS